jgi:hypothetical protein
MTILNSEYFVITVSTNGNFHRLPNESWLQALVRLIAYQMVEPDHTDRDTLFYCDETDLLDHLQAINESGKAIVLLIDELNKMGVPLLDAETSSFLTKYFLDKRGRYLMFSSHVQFQVDFSLADPAVSASSMVTSSSGRTIHTLPLPFCNDAETLNVMLGGGQSVTDLQITLAAGIPSLLYIMQKGNDDKEMTFKQRFDDVINRHLISKNMMRHSFVASKRNELLDEFLLSIVNGGCVGSFFEAFTTPFKGGLLFPPPYIPIILQFLGESAGVSLFKSLEVSAETVETGRDWELVVTFSIYIRSLVAKYCSSVSAKLLRGPFEIASDGVEDVQIIAIGANITTIADAIAFIQRKTENAKTIYIFQLAYSKFPDYDGFVCEL